jgi:hypothetical protein
MADEKYDQAFFLDLAAKGKYTWNAWRRIPANKGVRMTFAGVDFSEAPRDGIDFSGFEFGDSANFSQCKWRGVEWVETFEAFRRGRACFTGATFGGSASFAGAAFGAFAGFTGATFGVSASFAGAAFGEFAGFTGVTFGHGAFFDGAAFGGGARFDGAAFGAHAAFDGAAFGVMACFDGAAFGAEATFAGAAFGNMAIFSHGPSVTRPPSPARPSVVGPPSPSQPSGCGPASPARPSVPVPTLAEPISKVGVYSPESPRSNGPGTLQARFGWTRKPARRSKSGIRIHGKPLAPGLTVS